MRYYHLILNANSDKIAAKTKSKLSGYMYDSCIIEAVNSYMMKNVINSVSFFGYREEENTILAAFSFDENECSYEESYDNVEKLLKNDMGVNKISKSEEITIYRFLDCFAEGRRRGIISTFNKIIDEPEHTTVPLGFVG